MKRKNILSKVRLAIAEVMQGSSHDDFILQNQWSFQFEDSDWEKLSQALKKEFMELPELPEEFITAEHIKNFVIDSDIASYIEGIFRYQLQLKNKATA